MLSNKTTNDEENIFSPLSKIIMAISLAIICILGVVGNLMILIIAVRKKNYKYVTNCYIINLALTDLLFLLISVPLTTYLGLTNTWILHGLISCRIHIYLAYVLLQTTCYTLVAMSIDRCLYVTSSHPRPRWRTPWNTFIICSLIWIVSIAFVFPYTILISSSTSSKDLKNFSNDCSLSTYHPLFTSCLFPFCTYYLLPLLVIVLCHTKVFFHMRSSSKKMTRHRRGLLRNSSVQWQRRRVTRTLLLLTFAFAVCWLPIHTLELLNCHQAIDKIYKNYASLLDTIRIIAHALSYFNSCLNPFLYGFFNREFFV